MYKQSNAGSPPLGFCSCWGPFPPTNQQFKKSTTGNDHKQESPNTPKKEFSTQLVKVTHNTDDESSPYEDNTPYEGHVNPDAGCSWHPKVKMSFVKEEKRCVLGDNISVLDLTIVKVLCPGRWCCGPPDGIGSECSVKKKMPRKPL